MPINRSNTITANHRIARFCRRAGVQSVDSALSVHVSRVLAEYGRTDPPFDARDLCRTRNVEVEVKKLTGCDARLIPIPGGYIAEVHSEDERERRSFSACHELGHTLFSSESSDTAECDLSPNDHNYQREEVLCNSFAAQVLMPTAVFTAEAKRRSQTWKEVNKIAGIFEVSQEAAIRRILDLDLWKGIHMVVRPTPIGGLEETFTLEWFTPSASLCKNPIGTVVLVQKIMEWLHSGGAQVFRMSYAYEADLKLKVPIQLTGHYFSNRKGRFARLFAVILPHRQAFSTESILPATRQKSLFLS